MKAQLSVTSGAVVRVYADDNLAQLIVIQNNGAGVVRYTLGGSTTGVADVPTTSTGIRLLAGDKLVLNTVQGREGFIGAVDMIAESTTTTIDVVTNGAGA